MSKSVLVINTPTKCIECEFSEYISGGWFCLAKYRFERGGEKWQIKNLKEISSFCPLRPLPEKTIDASDDYFHGYCNGRNDCIDEVLGETE